MAAMGDKAPLREEVTSDTLSRSTKPLCSTCIFLIEVHQVARAGSKKERRHAQQVVQEAALSGE